MRDPQAVILNVGSLKVRIHPHEVARGSCGARYDHIRWEDRACATPCPELVGFKFGGLNHNIATECRASHPLASAPYRHTHRAGARRVGGKGDGRAVLELILVHPLD